jgi:hypothetical protein
MQNNTWAISGAIQPKSVGLSSPSTIGYSKTLGYPAHHKFGCFYGAIQRPKMLGLSIPSTIAYSKTLGYPAPHKFGCFYAAKVRI